MKPLLYKDEMASAPTQKHLSEGLSEGGEEDFLYDLSINIVSHSHLYILTIPINVICDIHLYQFAGIDTN